MTKIDEHLQQRENLFLALTSAQQQIVENERKFWVQQIGGLFDKYPDLSEIRWNQGSIYNDEYSPFNMVDFTINGMMLCVDDYIYQLRDKNEKTDQSMIFLFPRKNEDDWFDSKNTARLIEQSRIKYPQLIAAAADFIALCDTFANRYGKRYFAQTFGRSASVIFTKKGMSLGEFRDDSYGASEEIWG